MVTLMVRPYHSNGVLAGQLRTLCSCMVSCVFVLRLAGRRGHWQLGERRFFFFLPPAGARTQFSFLCPVCVMLRLLHELRAAQRAVCKHQRWFSAAAAGNNDFLRKYSSATPSGSRKFLLLTPELAESTASCIAETFSNKDEAFTWALNLKRHHWHSLTIPFIERAANGGCSIMPCRSRLAGGPAPKSRAIFLGITLTQ